MIWTLQQDETDSLLGLCRQDNTTLRVLEIRCRNNKSVSLECISGIARTYPALGRLAIFFRHGVNDVSVQAWGKPLPEKVYTEFR